MTTWQKELQKNIRTLDELQSQIDLTKNEIAAFDNLNFPLNITRHYFSLIDKNDSNCPIRKQCIPNKQEQTIQKKEEPDPIGDLKHNPLPGLIHRYPDRCLIFPKMFCAGFCRFCFRRSVAGKNNKNYQFKLKPVLNYLKKHSGIKEIILSGGDPLILDDNQLAEILAKLNEIKHLRWIRIHTRVPVTLPQRVTPQLAKMLQQYCPLWIVIHINHPREISPEFIKNITHLQKNQINLLSQTVLLKGINDKTKTLQGLFYKLTEVGIKPYYLHQADLAPGTGHFRISIKKGQKIMSELQKTTSGICLPKYMLDSPDGTGKKCL